MTARTDLAAASIELDFDERMVLRGLLLVEQADVVRMRGCTERGLAEGRDVEMLTCLARHDEVRLAAIDRLNLKLGLA